LFIVRQGKNYIGSGIAESEGGRPCEVQITTDPELSNEHAIILCRAGRYELFDCKSTNGTFLGGNYVGGQGAEVPDRSKIKTGSTVWTFLTIEDDASVVQDPATRPNSQPQPKPGETQVP
jgi:hypothetical protein